MAQYLVIKKLNVEAEYNGNTTDNKVDFSLAILNGVEKTWEHDILVVAPQFVGVPASMSFGTGTDVPVSWLTGISVIDEQQGNITASLTADDSDIPQALGKFGAIGTYELIYTAEDADGNEFEVIVPVTIIE
jgi:hypothetical protein